MSAKDGDGAMPEHLLSADGYRWSALFRRYAIRRVGLLIWFLASGFAIGVAYRYFVDLPAEREMSNYLRSGVHGMGVAFVGWTVQTAFASIARGALGTRLRRLPVAAEILIRSIVMTIAIILAGLLLQLVLYAEPYHLRWATGEWFFRTLPIIIAMGLAISIVAGAVAETARLVGGPLLGSVLLGTYHRPAREQLIVMFLDLAGSTTLAEELGELRVHDLITRFFFDIDEAISDHGGRVHAYVGDEVIITWPLTDDPKRNARPLSCFLAIEQETLRLAAGYQRDFGVAPQFRAGMQVGPVVVSECGDAKRQLAYFGDTMNVAARLCDHCKRVGERLIVSADLLRQAAIPAGLRVGEAVSIELRGRREHVESHAVQIADRSIHNSANAQFD